MDRLLAIDTSTRFAAVGLQVMGQRWEKSWRSAQNHGVELMAAVEALTHRAGVGLAELDGIAVATGPGGFSALRVGLSAAKGLAIVRNLPVIGVSTYDLEVARIWPSRHPLIAVIDAGSAGLAWARYEPTGETEADVSPESRRVAAGVDQPSILAASAPSDATFCGEGVARLADLIPTDRLILSEPPTRRIGDLIALAKTKWVSGDVTQLAALQPEYARPPSITKPSR